MMRMLEAGGLPVLVDHIRQPDIDNPNGYYEFEPVKQVKEDSGWLAGAYGKAVKMVYLLLYDLPKDHYYKVIFMRRRLEEVIASQDTMLMRRGKQASSLNGAQLAQVFRVHLEKIESWISEQHNFEMIDINYYDLVNNPKSSVQDIDGFLGYSLDIVSMAEIVDPSLYRQVSGKTIKGSG